MPNHTQCPHGHSYDVTNTYWQARRNGTKTPICRICQKERMRRKRESNPSYARDNMRTWRAKNPERNRKNWTELRASKKMWLDAYKAKHPCITCGEQHIACLDFHHRDPEQKELTLSLAIARASLERVQQEVEKCDILCSNCHRKLHWHERQSDAFGNFG